MADRRNATSTRAGVLRPDEFAAHADVERLECSSELSRWVENYWCLRWDLPPDTSYVSSVLPHPAGNLTVELGPPRPGVGDDRVVVTGVVTERFDVPLTGSGWVFGVKFRPGGLHSFSGVDANRLTDLVVPACDVLSEAVCAPLRDLTEATPWHEAADVIERALGAYTDDGNGRGDGVGYDTVLTLIDDMLADRTIVRVGQLEERHAIGRRQVERLFARYVGVGPKWVLARYRLHDVVLALDAGYDGSLADLAANYGWYDQAHFTRDFVSQVGVTPGAYRAGAPIGPE